MVEFVNTDGKHVFVRACWIVAVYENDGGIWSVWLSNGHAHNVTEAEAMKVVQAMKELEGESWR